MRLDFDIDENSERTVNIVNKDGDTINFSYTELIRLLYTEKCIEESTFCDKYSDEEKDSINVLVNNINNEIKKNSDDQIAVDIVNAENTNETADSDLV